MRLALDVIEGARLALDRRAAEVAPLEEGDDPSVGYFAGFLNAIAFARGLLDVAPCVHQGGTVQREVCEDCGEAFP